MQVTYFQFLPRLDNETIGDDFKMKMLTSFAIVLIFLCCPRVSSKVTCLSCKGVSPSLQCNQTTLCSNGQMCYTKLSMENNGAVSLDYGCENKTKCGGLLDGLVIGKRSSPKTCFECCSHSKCNDRLCLLGQNLGHTGGDHCPDNFKRFNDSCFLVWPVTQNRTQSQHLCSTFSATLATVQSQAEQDFLAKELKSAEHPSIQRFWLGGHYDHVKEAWLWEDGSNFTYSHWLRDQTPHYSNLTHFSHYAIMGSPDWITAYKDAPWFTTTRDHAHFGVICQTHVALTPLGK